MLLACNLFGYNKKGIACRSNEQPTESSPLMADVLLSEELFNAFVAVRKLKEYSLELCEYVLLNRTYLFQKEKGGWKHVHNIPSILQNISVKYQILWPLQLLQDDIY